jgi:hypothetical protein
VTLKVTWPQALAWRLDRHMLARLENASTEDVVRRLCGVQAQVASSAELAVRLRQKTSQPGDVAAALAEGRLIKTWAMRGTLHLFTPETAGRYLSLIAATRTWERPIWTRYFGITPALMQELRVVVREVLGDRAMTREELAAAITRRPRFEPLKEAFGSSWGTAFKPLAWQGDICFGPSQGSRVTFIQPSVASKAWVGVPAVDDAWPSVVLDYLSAYGPATADGFSAWLSRGTISKRQLKQWFAQLSDKLAPVEVEGEPMFVRTEDLDALARTKPTKTVRLLGGFDQWVLGPGTDDGHVTPKERRRDVSRQAGWISPLVVFGGVVSGTWQLDGDRTLIGWFKEAGSIPQKELQAEVGRVGKIAGRDLRPEFSAG